MRRREGEAEMSGETVLAGIKRQAEEGCLGNTGNAESAAGYICPVDEHQTDDFTEGKRHDGKIVTAQTQDRKAQNDTPCCSKNTGNRQQHPEGEAKIGRQQRIGIGADCIEGDVTQIEKTGEAHHDVEAPGQHHIDEDLNAEIIDPFERSLPAQKGDNQDGVDKKEGNTEAREVAAHERRAFVDRSGRLLALGKLCAPPALAEGRQQTGNDQPQRARP